MSTQHTLHQQRQVGILRVNQPIKKVFATMWICPACKAPLTFEQRQWQCENSHSYDVAKEGYVNLLLANQKNSKEPGDNKAMVNARRVFLEQGYYQPLADTLAELINHFVASSEVKLYDAGCGEGYYLNHVAQALQQLGKTIQGQGSDIAKVAVQKAAKKYSNHQFAVASSFQLTKMSKSIDALIQIFAPLSPSEVSRVLVDDGIWLSVNPAAAHLQQLKQALYAKPQPFNVEVHSNDHFALLKQQTLQFEIHIGDVQQRENLLAMTPYFWSTPPEKKPDVLAAMENLTIAFDIQVLQKRDGADE